MADLTDADRLAAASETILGTLENGPWTLITDPALQQIVREYVADTCHAVAAAAGLDEAMQRAHDATPTRLATTLPLPVGVRDRLARHLFLRCVEPDWRDHFALLWDCGSAHPDRDAAYADADEVLAVIAGEG